MTATKQRTRRTPEQMIGDLQKEIERIKTRAAQAKVKKDPALKLISGAVRSIDKAVTATGDAETMKALGEVGGGPEPWPGLSRPRPLGNAGRSRSHDGAGYKTKP